VQVGRVDVHQRYTGKASDERNELIKVTSSQDSDGTAKNDETRPEGVLLPLGHVALLAGCATKDLELDVAHGGEELHRCTDKNGHGVEELDGVDELAGLGEVGDDLDGDVLSESSVTEDTDRRENDGDDEHDDVEELAEVLGLLHAGLNGEDKADALEGEDGGPDGQREVTRVEEFDRWVETTHLGDRRDIVPVDVRQADENEDIGEKGGRSELGDVSDERHGYQNSDLDTDESIG